MNNVVVIPSFKAVDANPGGTLKRFNNYIEETKLAFRNATDGTAVVPSDAEKKAMTRLKGGEVLDTDTFDQAVKKVQDKLKGRTNKIVQRHVLWSSFTQSSKSFEKWSREISDAAKLIDFTDYD